MQALRGKVTFEQVKPEDLVDVAGSVSGRVDELLKWSLCEVRLAREATSASDRNRCATNALLSGRRALACLVEWYLARDYLSLWQGRSAARGRKGQASSGPRTS